MSKDIKLRKKLKRETFVEKNAPSEFGVAPYSTMCSLPSGKMTAGWLALMQLTVVTNLPGNAVLTGRLKVYSSPLDPEVGEKQNILKDGSSYQTFYAYILFRYRKPKNFKQFWAIPNCFGPV